MTDLVYQSRPEIHFATNVFVNTPLILQYEDDPLVAVVQEESAGYTTEFRIYHSDGTYLAKLRGSQIHPTEAGTKAGLKLRQPDRKTICLLNNQPIIELTRLEAAALKTEAELYTKDGRLLKLSDAEMTALAFDDNKKPLVIGTLALRNNRFIGSYIAVRLRDGGKVEIAVRRVRRVS